MKAIRVSDQVIELCDVPEPKGEGVLVNVEAVGICGSDLHLIDSNMMNVIPVMRFLALRQAATL